MILSDRDILTEVSDGALIIDPFYGYDLQPASYDIHLASDLLVFDSVAIEAATGTPGGSGLMGLEYRDLTPVDINALDKTAIPFREVDIRDADYHIGPDTFTLAQTEETVTLPSHLAASIAGVSTLVRIGLDICPSSPWVDPGFSGTLTLEISTLSLAPVVLRAGMRIGQLVFHQLRSPAQRPYGDKYRASRYQDQRGVQPARSHLYRRRDHDQPPRDAAGGAGGTAGVEGVNVTSNTGGSGQPQRGGRFYIAGDMGD